MELKVKAVEIKEKSPAEIEEELLKKQRGIETPPAQKPEVKAEEPEDQPEEEPEKKPDEQPGEAPADEQPTVVGASVTEEQVLTFLKDYGIESLEDLQRPETPEQVSAFEKYHRETGRGIEDYYKLQRDFSAIPEDSVLAEHMVATGEAADINIAREMIELDYGYDEDEQEEDPKAVKRKQLAKKSAVAKARNYFSEQKEKYRAPLESKGDEPKVMEELKRFRQQQTESARVQEENQRKVKWFNEKTNEVFSNGFKGFEVNVGDKAINYSPGKAQELQRVQSDIMNFFGKFLDDKGYIKDPVGYHRALSVALDPDKFAKTMYEQGKADALESQAAKDKNIDMRQRPQSTGKTGTQARTINTSPGRGLKIRPFKKP